jgi:hypothetical protein
MQRLRSECGVYGLEASRICVAALNEGNLARVASPVPCIRLRHVAETSQLSSKRSGTTVPSASLPCLTFPDPSWISITAWLPETSTRR